MQVVIGTTSELKVRALKAALRRLGVAAEVVPQKSESGVSDQPFGYDEMLRGARNRVAYVQGVAGVVADLYVAVESGLVEIAEEQYDIACVYACTKESGESTAFSAGYSVPDWMIREIREEHTELGFITRRLSGESDKDPIRYFSDGTVRREQLIEDAIVLALARLFNADRYKKDDHEV